MTMHPEHPDEIFAAVGILRAGGLVAFPTETVYGLGADARNPAAIQRIFDAKGRPSTNPLIVHVADEAVAKRYAANWPEVANRLARAFWPGPITLVLPKADSIVPQVTAGRKTVGLRAPNHPIALQLLREFDGPLAGPSANRSNRVSPTTAEHVRQGLGDRVEMILDGGPCGVGIESTVIDLTTSTPTILRPGGISREAIEAVIGRVELVSVVVDESQSAASPGQMAAHYSPRTPAYRFEGGEWEKVLEASGRSKSFRSAFVFLHRHQSEKPNGIRPHPCPLPAYREREKEVEAVTLPDDPVKYARELYSTLHRLDDLHFDAIWIEMPQDAPAWHAVRDRIRRAAKTLDDFASAG